MKKKTKLAIVATLSALAASFFVAGNFDVFGWSAEGRFILVFVCASVAVMAATCPLIKEAE